MHLNDLSGCNLVGLASSLSIIIGENLSSSDLAILSAFILILSDNLAMLSITKALEEQKKEEK
ncbi:MAG: hypothetical protein HFJ17_04125 [Clostridia bacterium]|nr:hypothetical protein [Clostridia bacterium]